MLHAAHAGQQLLRAASSSSSTSTSSSSSSALPCVPGTERYSRQCAATKRQARRQPDVSAASLGGSRGRLPKGVNVEMDPFGGGMPGLPGLDIPGGLGGPPGGAQEPEVVYDPESCFKGIPLRKGIIERRMMQRQVETDKEFAKAMKGVENEDEKAAIFRREMRKPPTNPDEVVEFFLDTPAEDLEYMVVRHRPLLTEAFFSDLDATLGHYRFSPDQSEEIQDRTNELDMLRKYLGEAVESLDKFVASSVTAADRMKQLLGAKDKKAMILEMAGRNEIDLTLLQFLQQNIDAARDADQEEAAVFMEKVKVAAAKYIVRPPGMPSAADMPSAPDVKPAPPGSALELPTGGPASPGSPIVLPGQPAPAASPSPIVLPGQA